MDNVTNYPVILIPTYQPGPPLMTILQDLQAAGYHDIVVVNDGSSSDCDDVLQQAEALDGVTLLHHPVNQGKGRALKTGFNHILLHYPDRVVITSDGDGQNSIEQIDALRAVVDQCAEDLVLGTRRYKDTEHVPLSNWLGNKLTIAAFYLLTGLRYGDTQTGLRAYRPAMMRRLLTVTGERFEFENVMLLAVRTHRVDYAETPIQAIYEMGNTSSHFNKVKDSVRIYSRILQFAALPAAAGLMGALLCWTLWTAMNGAASLQAVGAYGAGLLLSGVIQSVVMKDRRLAFVLLMLLKTALLCGLFYLLMQWMTSLMGIWWLCAVVAVPWGYRLYLRCRYGKAPKRMKAATK